MPVSAFSTDNENLRRNSGHSALVARWSMTRERIMDDERRMSEDQMGEMDGTGLYDRPNWPLVDTPARNESPDTVISAGSSISHLPRVEEESVTRDGVVGKPDDRSRPNAAVYMEQKDVSDVEDADITDSDEDEGLEEKEVRPSSLADAENGAPDSKKPSDSVMSGQMQPPNLNEPPPSSQPPALKLQVNHASSPDAQHDLSPFRDPDSSTSSRSGSIQQNVGAYQLQEDDAILSMPEPESPPESDNDQDHDIRAEEADVATPLEPRTPTSPLANGNSTLTSNGHVRQSSIMKGTPPPSATKETPRRQLSIVSRTMNNREKVRYSWQSVQDEEPNRPRIHIIKLVSNTATASAGFPQGEAFQFSISPGGRRIAAYNSARLYILQTLALPVGVSQDYAIKRRPLAVELVDEGNATAILADAHTVNIYDFREGRLRITRTIKLDFPTHSIALNSTGGLLAAAYEGGVEIFSLDPNALPTDRRAVRSQKMDKLMFSQDGSTLLGTTIRINASSTVVVSVPVFPAAANGLPTHEELKEAWCSELLHPENIRNSSHATFMREDRSTTNDRLFAWNGLADTFGVLNSSDLQYGSTDFPVVISPPLSTCGGLGAAIHSVPCVDEQGDTVAMIVNDRTIRLYIVPQRSEDNETTVEAHSIDHELDEGYGNPFSELRWVYSAQSLPAPMTNASHIQGRLIVTSPGGVVETGTEEEVVEDIEGGRIIMFDFDPQFGGQQGQTFSLTLGKNAPQPLEEPEVDIAGEVALVRRRTVNQSKGGLSQRPVHLGRAATTFTGRGDRSVRSNSPSLSVTAGNRRSVLSINSFQSEATRSLPDLMEGNEPLETFEEPYAQNAPRSQASLMRAASNAQRHRFQALEERNQERVSVDSSGNFLPLPEYTEEPNAPLPSRFRAMAGLDTPAPPPQAKPAIVTSANGDRTSPTSSTPSTAPASLAERFNSESAFATASSAQRAQQAAAQTASSQQSQAAPSPSPAPQPQQPQSTSRDDVQTPPSAVSATSPVGFAPIQRSDTFNSLGPMPRSLQRVYGNNASPPPGMASDFDAISPIATIDRPFPPRSASASRNTAPMTPPNVPAVWETLPEEEPSEPTFSSHRDLSPTFSNRMPGGGFPYRYSTSLLNPPGHQSPTRAPSTASSFGADDSIASTPSSRTRRLPPHIQSFRNAAAANASASLFPPTHPADHVPHREPTAGAGSVAHPITAWHPPAASPVHRQGSSHSRGHSRKSSLSNKNAFASTTKAKKLGFFRGGPSSKKDKNKLFGPQFAEAHNSSRPGTARSEGSGADAKSVFTTFTRRTTGGDKCVVM